MRTEAERIYTKKENKDTQDKSDDPYLSIYDFEIKLDNWKRILIIILNILTGGVGTLIEPFLIEKKKKRLIFAAIVLSFFQILHFLNGFSLLTKVKFIEDIYESISDDKVFEIIFGDEKKEKKNDNNGVQSEILNLMESFNNNTKLNVANLISKKSRIKFLKECFSIISGMSYCNSIFSILLDFMDDENNKILSYKVVLYSIFNPGGGIILASFALIPSCDCCAGIYNIKGIIICIISIIVGLIVMLTPISLILGLFLTKITDKMITVFPLKITLIFIGVIGILFSIITSRYNKNLIRDSIVIFKEKKEMLLPFEITFKVKEKLEVFRADFGCESFSRLIANMIIPGLGTMTLICKKECYCFKYSYFLTGIIQFLIGGYFFLMTILLNFQVPYAFSFFYENYESIFSSDNNEVSIYSIRFINYFYIIGLCFYFSGIVLILISDYLQGEVQGENIENIKFELSGIAGVALNILTGGLGTLLFQVFYAELYRPFDCNIECEFDYLCICRLFAIIFCNPTCQTIIVIWTILICGFIGYFGTLYCIFFPDLASKAMKITYPIFYCFFSISFGLLPLRKNYSRNRTACPNKRKINNKYQLIKINDVEIYNKI